jgi:hypothetical protein
MLFKDVQVQSPALVKSLVAPVRALITGSAANLQVIRVGTSSGMGEGNFDYGCHKLIRFSLEEHLTSASMEFVAIPATTVPLRLNRTTVTKIT